MTKYDEVYIVSDEFSMYKTIKYAKDNKFNINGYYLDTLHASYNFEEKKKYLVIFSNTYIPSNHILFFIAANIKSIGRGIVDVFFLKENITISGKTTCEEIATLVNPSDGEKPNKDPWTGNYRALQKEIPLGYSKCNVYDCPFVEKNSKSEIVKLLFDTIMDSEATQESLDLARSLVRVTYGDNLTTKETLQILQNPFYYGEMKYKGILYPHLRDTIINKSIFEKVQEKVKAIKKEIRLKNKSPIFIISPECLAFINKRLKKKTS